MPPLPIPTALDVVATADPFPPDTLVVNWRPQRAFSWKAYVSQMAAKLGVEDFGDAGSPVLYVSRYVAERMSVNAAREATDAAIAAELRWALSEMRTRAKDEQMSAWRAAREVQRCELAILWDALASDRQGAKDNLPRVQHERRSAYARARKVADQVLDVERWLAR